MRHRGAEEQRTDLTDRTDPTDRADLFDLSNIEAVLAGALDKARALGASGAKVAYRQSRRTGCRFENARLKSVASARGASYTVTVLADGRRGVAGGTSLADLDEIVARAAAMAKVGSASHFSAWPAPAATASVPRWSDRTAKLPRETLVDACRRIADALKAYRDDLYVEGGASRSEGEGLLLTTGGVRHMSRGTHWSISAEAQRTEGTDMLFAGFGRGWRDVNELFDPAAIAEHILADLRRGERTAPSPAGRTTAVLSPEMFGMLLHAVEMGVNGRNVAKGDSPLRGRIGQKVLDECLTLTDDPHVAMSPGAAEIDADGVPTRKMTIFDRGVLQGFLYDLDSAALAGAEPTGHDGCMTHNLQVLPGRRGSEEMLADVADGVYLKMLMGFGQGNLINGDFSCNVALGFRVRGGEIVGRVKNTMAAGNVYELLAGGVELSRDRDPALLLPHARVEGLSLAAEK